MTWYVYRENMNNKSIEKFNIFYHGGFRKDVEDAAKIAQTKEIFAELVQRSLRYYFWCKSEYEVVVTSWPPYIDKAELDRVNTEYDEYYKRWGHYPYCAHINPMIGEKVDFYDQVMMNWDAFIEYLWSNKNRIQVVAI